MSSIFENAKFGDPFLTRDGEKAILWRIDDSFTHKYILVLEDGNCAYCNEEGEDIDDYDDAIVSRYHEPEPIDEKELDKLANNFNYHDKNDRYDDEEIGKYYGFQEGFKVGYCKAKEE